jgi:TPR repeat protein
MGMDYEDGIHGLPKDRNLAAEWLRKSAEQGNVAAQFNLAMLLSSQPEELYFWLGLAAPHLKDDPLAKLIQIRHVAAGILGPDKCAEIDTRVKRWQADHPNQP